MRRLERHDAAPTITIGDVQLHALAGCIAQPGQDRAGDLGHWELVLGGSTQADQFESEAEASLRIASHESVHLECDSQSVGRRSRQTRLVLQARQVERTAGQGAEDGDPFVNDADTAYTVHERE